MTSVPSRARLLAALAVLAALAGLTTTPTAATTTTATTTATAAPAHGDRFRPFHAAEVDRTYRSAASVTNRIVDAGSTFRIRGTVTTWTGKRYVARPLRLQEHLSGSWSTISTKTSARRGAFTFKVEAGQEATTRSFRVKARRFKGITASTTKPVEVEVVVAPVEPPYDPTFDAPEPPPEGYVGAGDPTAWSYMWDGGGRWNPCRVIRWRYNPAGEGYPALADVKRAFAKVSGASGLQFRYEGATDFRMLPGVAIWEFPSDEMDISVGWANEIEEPSLEGGTVGLGGGGGTRAPEGADVGFQITKGYVLLDNGDLLPGGFDDVGWGSVLLHEILHATGLGHAMDDQQLMYPMAWEENVDFGAGDLTGMSRVGAPAGCL